MSGKIKLRFLSAFRDFFVYHHKSLEFRAKIFAAIISAKFDPDEDDFFILNDIVNENLWKRSDQKRLLNPNR